MKLYTYSDQRLMFSHLSMNTIKSEHLTWAPVQKVTFLNTQVTFPKKPRQQHKVYSAQRSIKCSEVS